VETLIIFCDPKRHRKSAAVVDDGVARAFIEAVVDAGAAWRATQAAVDLNRRLVLCVDADDDSAPWDALASAAGARVERVPDAPLGALRAAAFMAEFDRGARAVAAIGVDAPSLPVYLLDHAFRALGFELAVVGPTFDGGAWLVGAQRPIPPALADLPWGSSELGTRAQEQLSAHVLPFWYDVATPDDVARLRWHARALGASCPRALLPFLTTSTKAAA
jgi:glycosyltransferase A (GT-A) superfamily protein (DUF2064 family)